MVVPNFVPQVAPPTANALIETDPTETFNIATTNNYLLDNIETPCPAGSFCGASGMVFPLEC